MQRVAVRILTAGVLLFALFAVSPTRPVQAQGTVVTIAMPEPGALVGEGDVLIEGTVTSNGGAVLGVAVSLNGNPSLEAAMGPLDTFSIFYNMAPGEHEVSAEAFGADGPLPGASAAVVFTVGEPNGPPVSVAPTSEAPQTTVVPSTTAAPATTEPVGTSAAPATTESPVTSEAVVTTDGPPVTDGSTSTSAPGTSATSVPDPADRVATTTGGTTDHGAVIRPAAPSSSVPVSPPATCVVGAADPMAEMSADDSLLFLASERSLNRAEVTLSTPAAAGTYEVFVWVFDNESRANQEREQLLLTVGGVKLGPTPDLPGNSHGEFAELVSYSLGFVTLDAGVTSVTVEHAAAGAPGVGPESVRLRALYLASCDDDDDGVAGDALPVPGGPQEVVGSTTPTTGSAPTDTTAVPEVDAEEPLEDGDVAVLGTAETADGPLTPAAEVDGLATTGSSSQRVGYVALVMVLCGLCLAQAGRRARSS
jgi:hypothetical protein